MSLKNQVLMGAATGAVGALVTAVAGPYAGIAAASLTKAALNGSVSDSGSGSVDVSSSTDHSSIFDIFNS